MPMRLRNLIEMSPQGAKRMASTDRKGDAPRALSILGVDEARMPLIEPACDLHASNHFTERAMVRPLMIRGEAIEVSRATP